jgi:hypothetical protein
MHIRLFILATLTLAAGCSVGRNATSISLKAAHEAALADSLRGHANMMFERARALDIEGTLALYGRPDEFVHVDGGRLVDWPTLEAAIRATFARLTNNSISWLGPPRVIVLNRDAAVIVGVHRFAGGAGQAAHDGVWTGVLERTTAGWRIVHSHSTDAPPSR